MPKRARSQMPRPRLSRSRTDRPLVQQHAPDLPDNLWQLLAGILARSSPYDCLKLAMVCKGAHASIVGDDCLWMSVLRSMEDRHWKAAARRGTYQLSYEQPFPFVNLSAPPDFIRYQHNIHWHTRAPPPRQLGTLQLTAPE